MKQRDRLSYALLTLVFTAITFSAFLMPEAAFQIRGRLEGLKEGSCVRLVLLKEDAEGKRTPVVKDSVMVKSGRFSFNGETVGTTDAYLQAAGHRSTLSFYLEPGNIEISGHIDTTDNASITGTYNNDLQTKFRKAESVKYADIRKLYADSSLERAVAARKVAALQKEIEDNRKALIRKYPSAMVSGTYLYVMQDKVELDTLKALYAALSPAVKNTSFGKIVAAKIPARERTMVGKTAPDFSFVSAEGKKYTLADFRGKYLLLDFWASWCVPCRAENPHLKKAYANLKHKGLEIVSITLDDNKKKWEEAIIKDGLPWIHAGEVAGFAHPVARLYGVQPIPDNFLIAPDGKILARQLRGAQLEEVLENYIQ